jgi:diketogulonate reductase-like aldo/keto reductase
MIEKKEFGKTGFSVSRIGMGTYYDPSWIVLDKALHVRPNEERRVNAIKTGLELGLNLIDTAEIYGTERLVAKAIKGYDRNDIFIATKVWPNHFSFEKVISSCDHSLAALETSYIDLYQLHFPSNKYSITETMHAMEKLVDDGKIRHIGISNFSLEQTKEAMAALRKYEIISAQMDFSLQKRNIENDLVPFCRENNIAILPYYPLGHGDLTKASAYPSEAYNEIIANHGKISPSQIALNWFLTKFDFVFPIPRASNPQHVIENANSMGWKLSQKEIDLLENSFKQ